MMSVTSVCYVQKNDTKRKKQYWTLLSNISSPASIRTLISTCDKSHSDLAGIDEGEQFMFKEGIQIKPEYLMYQEEGMDEAFRVVSDVAGEKRA